MEEDKKPSLFSRVVNSKNSVILYIVTMAIFYFGSIIGGIIIARQVLPMDELIVMCGELIQNNLGGFIAIVIFSIIAFFSVLPIVGIFVSFLPCLIVSAIIWIIYIIGVAIAGAPNNKELI